jgi:hypothetical protein
MTGDQPPSMRDGREQDVTGLEVGDAYVRIRPNSFVQRFESVRIETEKVYQEVAGCGWVVTR